MIILASLLSAGCVGPHTTGGLWAQQNLQQELALSRMTDAERAAQARALEAELADEALATERLRLTDRVQRCPDAPGTALSVSSGDRVRDEVRIKIGDDAARLSTLVHIALADWYLRRANASGDGQLCDRARRALAASEPLSMPPTSSSVQLQPLGGVASVVRDPSLAAPPPSDAAPLTALSLYAARFTDGVTANAPLPQYLAAVYGGTLVSPTNPPAVAVSSVEGIVDALAPAYPQWEPDALWATLRQQ